MDAGSPDDLEPEPVGDAPPGTRRAVEAILMVADSPVELHLLAQVTETPPPVMEQLLADMAAAYAEDDRGFVLVKVAGGYRYQSHPDLTGYVERFVLEGQSARLSSAALETLAIVAYKQPISRAQVASIRGVNVDGVVRTLEQRGYIAEIARDPGPGQAVLFGTTATFLERMGLGSLDDLPPVADFVPGADVVEALEVGLRIDIDEPDLPVEPGGSDGPDASASSDEPIDLDDLG
jgi:segregation and condensation protein B